MRLNIVIHNHQAVGNFNSFFEELYDGAYKPFIDLLENHKGIKVNFHFTGPLIDWLSKNRISFLDRLGRLIEQNRVEIIGGPYYEPILTNLREKDIVGQISLSRTRLKKFLGVNPIGIWVPEFVWEERLTKIFVNESFNYTILPEEYFRRAGVDDEVLGPYYLTERYAKGLVVFPTTRILQELILDSDPEVFFKYLVDLAKRGIPLINYVDNGERFYTSKNDDSHFIYLDKLFSMIEKTEDLDTGLLREAVEDFLPKGLIYFPSLSTKEMAKWSLPASLLGRYENLEKTLDSNDFLYFVQGGFWENFLIKYKEANLLHKRLMHVSSRLEKFEEIIEKRTVFRIKEHIYKAQSNTAYWFGEYGGFYLPYLRGALFQNLIMAESLLEVQLSHFGDPYGIRIEDFDGDKKDEIIYSSLDYAVFLGLRYGTVVELDNRTVGVNVANVIKRQKELIHNRLTKKQRDALIIDRFPREIALLHVVPKGTTREELKEQRYRELLTYSKFSIIARSKRYVVLEAKGFLSIASEKIPIVIQKKYRFLKKGLEIVISAFIQEELSIDLLLVLESNFNLMKEPWGCDLEEYTSSFSIFNEYFSYGIKYNIETTDNIDRVSLVGYGVNTIGLTKDGKREETYQGTSLNYLVPVSLRPDKITKLTLGIYFI